MQFTLQFDGALADRNALNFYDASRAIAGFQRTLALVTHLALNGEIIVQAPALKGADIIVHPPEEGSWKIAATIIGGVFAVGAVGKDSPIGHVVTSVYDYVLYETMGFHVDYDRTLQSLYNEKAITEEKLDSLIEKAEPSIVEMHRPIVASKTALSGFTYSGPEGLPTQRGPEFSLMSFNYMMEEVRADRPEYFLGIVSSYNVNTFKGRIYVIAEKRTIPFELAKERRDRASVRLITDSLRTNADGQNYEQAALHFEGWRYTSKGGRLKRIVVTEVAGRDTF